MNLETWPQWLHLHPYDEWRTLKSTGGVQFFLQRRLSGSHFYSETLEMFADLFLPSAAAAASASAQAKPEAQAHWKL
jgi:hypothetical protein